MFARLRLLFGPPRPEDDPECDKQSEWAENHPVKPDLPGEFILGHARRVYGEFTGAVEALDAKGSEILRTSGMLATILVAASAAFERLPIWLILPSLLFFLLSMIIIIVARRPLRRHLQTPIRGLIESLETTQSKGIDHQVWLARSLHRTTEEMRVVQDWKAGALCWASWSLVAGVACFLLLPFFWAN